MTLGHDEYDLHYHYSENKDNVLQEKGLLQRCRGTCRVEETKFKDFPIKFETFIFTNRRSPKIF